MGKTRLSLSGAMAKVGLYQDGDSGRWFYPLGGAPSTHIIKAADGNRFPRETIMEALCLGAAGRCGFPAAECRLIDVDQGEPLLAIRRFDRAFGDSPRIVSTMPAPIRLHQEDFSQAASVPWKYEPTDGAYLPLISTIARRRCPNAFGEVNLLVSYTLFDYLIGNCDNHLRNYALLFDSTWNACEVAPIYDVASTVAYPSILLEMGVSFGGDRRIDHVTSDLLGKTIAACGLPAQLAFNTLSDLAENLPGAIEEEADNLSGQGFKEVRGIIKPLIDGVAARANLDH